MGELCKDGFVCFGDNNLATFFSKDQAGSVIPKELDVILVVDGARTIPVIFDKANIVKVDDSSAYKILKSVHSEDHPSPTLVIAPDLYTKEGIVTLKEKKIPFLAPVNAQEIEEQKNFQDFFEGIISPERMLMFIGSPIFVKKGRFEVKGDEIDGYGYFNPRSVPKEYKKYFKNLEIFHTAFERTDRTTSINPDVFIGDIAKGYSRYFSGTKKDKSLEIGFNPGTVLQRQKVLGTVLLYHSGTWDELECYRNFEIWKMTGLCFNLYRQLITADSALRRGRLLLALINTIVQVGIL
jgi:hypothetical protein